MGHDQRSRHYLHPTSRHCSSPCRQHPRLRNTGARRALFCLPSTTNTTGGGWTPAREVKDLSASGSSGRAARVSAVPSPEKPPLTPKKDKAPVLPSSLPNESALLMDSEDDSDTNETFNDAEMTPDKAHAPMPPSPLSPCRTRVSGPNSSLNARTQLDLRMNPCARRLRVGLPKLPRRPRSPPWWRPAWVVVIGLQLISARSGQPRPWRLLLRLRSCIAVTRARWRLLRVRACAETMSRLRVASTTPTASWHLICVIGSRARLGTTI